MPLIWPGGWWRLSDIIEYEIVSTKSILRTSALYHEDILKAIIEKKRGKAIHLLEEHLLAVKNRLQIFIDQEKANG